MFLGIAWSVGSSPLTRGKRDAPRHARHPRGLIPAHAGKTRRASSRSASSRAHPRSRGENAPARRAGRRHHGSSPLTRGKPVRAISSSFRRGLIPAHAGKTGTAYRNLCVTRAHPRSRGENMTRKVALNDVLGSSPLTRGKRRTCARDWSTNGLIPAHAGKTQRCGGAATQEGAHPRSRGENAASSWGGRQFPGSSPLTRGKPLPGTGGDRRRRLIPAHAGKTTSHHAPRKRRKAHPRSRGENEFEHFAPRPRGGSSPLTRGKRLPGGRSRRPGGLIPAHAGKTDVPDQLQRRRGAHPRSRGENAAAMACAPMSRGSSPLTRGKRPRQIELQWPTGLIPAHAGKTTVTRTARNTSRAHPRSRGENSAKGPNGEPAEGSSPLTRGKRSHRRGGSFQTRLIPAHAGKTSRGDRVPAPIGAHPRSRGENLQPILFLRPG